MDFNSFLSHLSKIQHKPLGGMESQFKMAPKLRLKFDDEKIAERNPRDSAVMALFYPDKEHNTRFLLTLRPNYNGAHSGQISFPGGKVEKEDKNLTETALRETFEETGIKQKDIVLYRQITKTYIPPSNFWVTPFIGYIDFTPTFTPNSEVDKFIEVKTDELLKDSNLKKTTLSTSYIKNMEVPCFSFNNHIVWGATAMILSEIKDLLK